MAWAVAYLRRDLLRAMRLGFALALSAVTAVSLIQIGLLGLPPRTALAGMAAIAGLAVLRIVESVRMRPVPLWVDALELAALLPVMMMIGDVDVNAVVGPFLFHILCRSSVAGLPRLLPLAAGYAAIWVTAGVLRPGVEIRPGTIVAISVIGLLMYCTRLLLQRLQEQNRSQSVLLQTVLRRFPSPVLITDPAGNVLLANPAALDLLGWPSERTATPAALSLLAGTASNETREIRLTRPDGTGSEVLVEAVPIEDGGGTVFALMDVSAQRVYEESLHHAAYHDALTGLPNRAMLWRHLDAAAAGERPYAVLHIDLDNFRSVNDNHGRQAGDDLLTGVAHRLRDAALAETRTADHRALVARLGGDEFAVLLPEADEAAASRLAAALRATFDQPFQTSAGRLTARASIATQSGFART
ncbi:diguanylate cyclase domain-containing protein [Dactylosporangium sp. CA-233914]|uniref:diguanylate cyclase domain-containing protein n=1 Tax=Dactylosporangium sp. CA-233914 TaxID=3239934 RepID=UPI003D8E99C0